MAGPKGKLSKAKRAATPKNAKNATTRKEREHPKDTSRPPQPPAKDVAKTDASSEFDYTSFTWSTRTEEEDEDHVPITKKSAVRVANIRSYHSMILERERHKASEVERREVQAAEEWSLLAARDASARTRAQMTHVLESFFYRLRCKTYSTLGSRILTPATFIMALAHAGKAPCIDAQTGQLKHEYVRLGRPENCPYLLWWWLSDDPDDPRPCLQGDLGGWHHNDGPSAVWLERWARDELSASEIKAPTANEGGARRVGFATKRSLALTVTFDKERPPSDCFLLERRFRG